MSVATIIVVLSQAVMIENDDIIILHMSAWLSDEMRDCSESSINERRSIVLSHSWSDDWEISRKRR